MTLRVRTGGALSCCWQIPEARSGLPRSRSSRLASARVELRILGPLEVRVDGTPVPIRGAIPRLILAVLIARRGTTISGDSLAEVIWGRPNLPIRPMPSTRRSPSCDERFVRSNDPADQSSSRCPAGTASRCDPDRSTPTASKTPWSPPGRSADPPTRGARQGRRAAGGWPGPVGRRTAGRCGGSSRAGARGGATPRATTRSPGDSRHDPAGARSPCRACT